MGPTLHAPQRVSIEEQITGVYIVCKYAKNASKRSSNGNKINVFLV